MLHDRHSWTTARLMLLVGGCLALGSFGLHGSLQAAGGIPRLISIEPAGAQKGTTIEVDLTGQSLEQVREILFYEPGITVESIQPVTSIIGNNGREQNVPEGTRVRARLKVADTCELGAHGLRVRTASGLTDYRRFFVSPYPIVEENETAQNRNDKPESATPIEGNVTIHGSLIEATDVDLYRVTIQKGQRISAEIEAARLGVERGIPDLHLTIYDPDGKKLASADGSDLFVQDPVLSVLAEKSGAHLVEVRHCMYNGARDRYRLHVGTFTRPLAVYPAGGMVGSQQRLQLLGDPKGPWSQDVQLPVSTGDMPFVAVDPKDGASAPSPNRLRVSPFPNVLETEPNDSAELATASTRDLPVAFNGIINHAGDVDCFRFRARKGEQVTFHALANALGSPVDPAIWIRSADPQSKFMVRASDSRPNQLGLAPANGLIRDTHDPILEFVAPADGDYILGVENERNEGGPTHIYRVEASPTQNAVHTYIAPEPDSRFQPQLRQSISVAPGNRFTVQVGIFNTNRPYNGDLELVGVNLPPGVTVHAPRLSPGTTRIPVVFEASADAKPQAALIDLVARPVGSSETITSGYRQTILMNAYGNNDFYLHTPINKLALAITEPAPFTIEVEEPKTSLVQNGEMSVPFKIQRRNGFDGPVTVQMDWKPNGVSTATPITIARGETEGSYLLGASRNASPGSYMVTLTAMSGGSMRGYNDRTERVYLASRPFAVTIAEPHVAAQLARTSIERGKTAELVCKLNHLQAFEGKAQATLARLPRGVELVDPMQEITSADKEVRFTLRATPEALVGNYQGIVFDLTVIEKGQPVRQLSGSGRLRIDSERGASSTSK